MSGRRRRTGQLRMRPVAWNHPSTTASAKISVQHADQLANPSAATRCRRKAFEHANNDWCRPMHRLLNEFGTNVPIVTGGKLGCPGRVSACSDDMFHLCGLGQRMQVGSACRRHRCPRCIARSRRVRALGSLKRRPSRVAQSLAALTASSELLRSTNRVSRPRVVRLIGLEYVEYRLRAPRCKCGHLTERLLAQSDPAGLPCHGFIFDQCVRLHLTADVERRSMIIGRRGSPSIRDPNPEEDRWQFAHPRNRL